MADFRATDNLNDYGSNSLFDGETYASEEDFLKGVDLSAWEMATFCSSCHVGGALVEKDRTGVRYSMRGPDVRTMMEGYGLAAEDAGPYNAYDFYVDETYDETTGMPAHQVKQAPWGIPATTDFQWNNAEKSNVVYAPAAWFQEGNPYVTAGMAEIGQAMMPNVREMDCLFCHMAGYNNIVASVAGQMGYLMASPSLGSGLMNMFTMAYQPHMISAGAYFDHDQNPDTAEVAMVSLSATALNNLKAEPPSDNCRQCHIPTTMTNFSDMFDKFLAAAPMDYNPDAPMASLINGMVMPSYDLNAALLPYTTQTATSRNVFMIPASQTWWFYDTPTEVEANMANGPFGIFPMALDMHIDVMGEATAGRAVGGGKDAMTGPLYYQGGTNQNALKKSTIPFPRADFFKRGDNWDSAEDDVHYGLGCAGCHFNTNISNPDLTQCDPGRGFSTMGGIENGSGPAGIDTRSTVKRCQDCHVTGTNYEGAPIATFNAPDPSAAHAAAGLMVEQVQAVRLDASGNEELFFGNHMDAIACQVCHIKKDNMSVRSLDSTSGNRYPSITGLQSYHPETGAPLPGNMVSMFTDPMGTGSTMFPSQEWTPLYGWDDREQKRLPDGSINPNWRREIIPINMIVAYMWNDFGTTDHNGDGAELWNLDPANADNQMPISWDPPIMRDMKAGMNFAPGPFATIPVGFGNCGQAPMGTGHAWDAYCSVYGQDGNLNGSFDYVGIYGGNVMLTNANEIAAYKAWREAIKDAEGNTGKSWADTKLTVFGGNPFQIEHGVVSTSVKALGKNGCTDCHSADSNFFSGAYDMTGEAVPAGATEMPMEMMMRPVEDFEVTGYTSDLFTGSEANAKLDRVANKKVVLDVPFDEEGCWDAGTKIFDADCAEPNAKRTTDLDRAEFLYPHDHHGDDFATLYGTDLYGKTYASAAARAAHLTDFDSIEALIETAEIGVSSAPVAAISAISGSTGAVGQTLTVEVGTTVTFNAGSNPGNFTYEWFCNDKVGKVNGQTYRKTFDKKGTWTVALSAVKPAWTDAGGKTHPSVLDRAYQKVNVVLAASDMQIGVTSPVTRNTAATVAVSAIPVPHTNLDIFWGDGTRTEMDHSATTLSEGHIFKTYAKYLVSSTDTTETYEYKVTIKVLNNGTQIDLIEETVSVTVPKA